MRKISRFRQWNAEKVGPNRILIAFPFQEEATEFLDRGYNFVVMEEVEFDNYHVSRIQFLSFGLLLGTILGGAIVLLSRLGIS